MIIAEGQKELGPQRTTMMNQRKQRHKSSHLPRTSLNLLNKAFLSKVAIGEEEQGENEEARGQQQGIDDEGEIVYGEPSVRPIRSTHRRQFVSDSLEKHKVFMAQTQVGESLKAKLRQVERQIELFRAYKIQSRPAAKPRESLQAPPPIFLRSSQIDRVYCRPLIECGNNAVERKSFAVKP